MLKNLRKNATLTRNPEYRVLVLGASLLDYRINGQSRALSRAEKETKSRQIIWINIVTEFGVKICDLWYKISFIHLNS